MKKTTYLAVFAAFAVLASSASANFLVREYVGAGSLAAVQSAVATNATPSFTGTSSVIDFFNGVGGSGAFSNNFAFPGNLSSNFGVDFKANLNITADGNYTFRTNADDGVQLLIDGTAVITDSTEHPPLNFFSNALALTRGLHSIELLYFQGPVGATVELSASSGTTNIYHLVGAADGLQTTTVPEPTTLALLGLGLLGFAGLRGRSAT